MKFYLKIAISAIILNVGGDGKKGNVYYNLQNGGVIFKI